MTSKAPLTLRMPKVEPSVPPAVNEATDPVDAHITERALATPRPIVRDRANLTLLTGPSAGQVHPLAGDETVIGRDDDVDVKVADVAISRRHAKIARGEAGEYVLEDLGSTNGTYVGSEQVQRRVLRSGEQIQVGPNMLYRFAVTDEVEERLQRQLFESSIRDPLTHAYNRKYLNERLAAEVAHARRHGTKLALLMIDLDDFKRVNDDRGHLAGDIALRRVAETIVTLIRLEDVFARFGGEEFVVLTRGDGVRNAGQLAERLRKGVADATIAFESLVIPVTISVGVSELHELSQPAEPVDLIEAADKRLYRAKSLGRNRVVSTDD
jgi:two-component system, cell cycle response regulator